MQCKYCLLLYAVKIASHKMSERQDDLENAIKALKAFLQRFVFPFACTDEEKEEYHAMQGNLNSNRLLISVWIASRVVPDEANNFDNLISALGIQKLAKKRGINNEQLQRTLALFRKLLHRLSACVK